MQYTTAWFFVFNAVVYCILKSKILAEENLHLQIKKCACQNFEF